MKLTAEEEAYSQAISSCMTQADAYRTAYDTSKTKPDVIWVNASKMASDAKVVLRVEELKAVTASKALWTRERSVVALAAIADGSEAKANEITAAIKELNLMHGFNAPTKIEIEGAIIHRIERVVIQPK